MNNSFKTFILLLIMTLILLILGELIAGKEGLIFALIFAIIMNFISYWFSDSIVLSTYRAKEVSAEQNPELYRIVSDLALSANLPMPKVYCINSSVPNAFATGRDPKHAAVAVTTSILNLLNEQELKGVIGHELSHVKNRDILISCIAATMAGAIMMIVRFAYFFRGGNNRKNYSGLFMYLAIIIFAPIAASLIQFAISRSREYIADEDGAKMANDPLALASALKKLTIGNNQKTVVVNPNTAHMFIVKPFTGKDFVNLFSTHPPVEERIKRLEKMANIVNTEQYDIPKVIY